MIGHLYRYPHPYDSTRFIYVGQGAKRDWFHRSGGSSFGRRFKRDFPNTALPQPVREQVEVQNQIDLNELETIWMFQYHTWRGYPNGMNLRFPGSTDYVDLGLLGGLSNKESGHWARISKLVDHVANGKKSGTKAVISGQIISLGYEYGKKNVENGHLDKIRTRVGSIKGGKTSGKIQGPKNVENGTLPKALHIRWHVKRDIVNPSCKFCKS